MRVRGLPERLPEGEHLLWQGSPDWRVLARRSFHARALAAYFAVIASVILVQDWASGGAAAGLLGAARAMGVAAAPLLLIVLYAWAVARSSVYTITSKRVAMQVGVALSFTVNLPFARIESIDMLARTDGSGDLALRTDGTVRLAYAVLWPHARPWRLSRAQPSLRGLRDVAQPAQVLARALAAASNQPVPVLATETATAAPGSAPVPA